MTWDGISVRRRLGQWAGCLSLPGAPLASGRTGAVSLSMVICACALKAMNSMLTAAMIPASDLGVEGMVNSG